MSGPFINARLLDQVAYGFQMGPDVGDVRIKTMRNRHEERNRNTELFLWRGTAPFRRVQPDTYHVLLGAFLAAWGPWSAFRFHNHLDSRFAPVTGQPLGTAPAGLAAVQLRRTYDLFGGLSHTRDITKPVAGTVTVYEAGTPKTGSVDDLTGLFIPDEAWDEGAPLTADFDFDIPMRFTTTYLPFDYADFQRISANIGLIEVIGE